MTAASTSDGFPVADRMMRRIRARDRVMRCVETVKDPALPLDSLPGATEEMELACRDLANLVDKLPSRERPAGWALDPDGADA